MKLVLVGQFYDYSGYGWAVRAYAHMLSKRNDVELFLADISIEDAKSDQLFETDAKFIELAEINNMSGKVIALHCHLPSMWGSDYPKKENVKKISMIFWETNRLPYHWMECLKKYSYDRVLVHSDTHLEEIRQQVFLPIGIVRTPVMDNFRQIEKSELMPRDKLTFLSVSEWTERKGWEELISSYYSEFFIHSDVNLVIKTYSSTVDVKKITERVSNLKKQAGIVSLNNKSFILPKCTLSLIPFKIPEKEMVSLYHNCDVYITTTRGEGFGLPIAKAALSGKPLIVPNRGGHNYFVPDSSYKIQTFTSAISDNDMPVQFYTNSNMHLFQCDFISIKEQMRRCYNDYKSGKLSQIGELTRKHVSEFLNSDTCFKILKENLQEL